MSASSKHPELKRLPRVYLVRHAETEWSLSGAHTGRTDIPLTANGERVIAKAAKDYVGRGELICPKRISHVFLSPRQRTQRTFQLMNEAGGNLFDKEKNSIVTTEQVREWDYGDYEGKTSKEIHAVRPDWSIWTDGCPNGETPEQVSARCDELIAQIEKIHEAFVHKLERRECDVDTEGADVLIVSHGHFTRCFLARWARLALNRGEILIVDAGSVNVAGYQHRDMAERSLFGLNLHSYLL